MPVLGKFIVAYLVAAFCFWMTIPHLMNSTYPLFHITNGVSWGGVFMGVVNVAYGTVRLVQFIQGKR